MSQRHSRRLAEAVDGKMRRADLFCAVNDFPDHMRRDRNGEHLERRREQSVPRSVLLAIASRTLSVGPLCTSAVFGLWYIGSALPPSVATGPSERIANWGRCRNRDRWGGLVRVFSTAAPVGGAGDRVTGHR